MPSLRTLATYSFTCNVGPVDRLVRLLLGIAMVLAGVVVVDNPGIRVAAGVVGVAIGLTGLVSRCGIYYLLGVSSRSREAR